MASEQARIDAIESARARRADAAARSSVRIEWFIDQVSDHVRRPLESRVRIATEFLKTRIVQNISRPVTKKVVTISGRSRTVVSNRSKPGEFPKADTTLLMKTIFTDYKSPAPGEYLGYVGTPLDYGLILELKMNRSFLLRTFYEERDRIYKILGGPI